eukprot:scaffold60733_cov49-Phaeocystis_antarctica.AAC.2
MTIHRRQPLVLLEREERGVDPTQRVRRLRGCSTVRGAARAPPSAAPTRPPPLPSPPPPRPRAHPPRARASPPALRAPG